MRYQPVKVVFTTRCEKVKGYRHPEPYWPKDWKPVESYWEVTTKLVGDCGHKHATEAEAYDQCYKAMCDRWRNARWPKYRSIDPKVVKTVNQLSRRLKQSLEIALREPV